VEQAALALEMVNITKTFPGVRALDEVSFGCGRGEVHALCGDNGAGKSTLIKILGGIYRPDTGHIRLVTVIQASTPLRLPSTLQSRGNLVIYRRIDRRLNGSLRKSIIIADRNNASPPKNRTLYETS
jgi:ABC-type sugar transport system ATPase subunit